MSFLDNYPGQNVSVLPATPIQNYPQQNFPQAQQGPDLTHLQDVFNQYMSNKQPQNANGLTEQILSNRFQPTSGDVGMSIANNAQSFLAPNMFQPTTPGQVMAQRYTSELSPYTQMLDAQNKAKSSTPSNVQEWQYYNSLSPGDQTRFLGMKRATQGVMIDQFGKMVPIEGAPNALGQVKFGEFSGEQNAKNTSDLQFKPQIAGGEAQQRQAAELNYAAPIAAQKKAGEDLGTKIGAYREDLSVLPQLQQAASELSQLGKTATYTVGGQLVNNAMRQSGAPVPQGAIDRAAYISKVDNQILPLLRRTFGAQFTKAEGDTLRSTLGNPDLSPPEKDAVLSSFIEQKQRTIQSLGAEINMGGAQVPQMNSSQLSVPVAGGLPPPPSPNQLPDAQSIVDELRRRGKVQ